MSYKNIEPIYYLIVIIFVIIIWFGNCLNNQSYYIIWLTFLKFKQSKM